MKRKSDTTVESDTESTSEPDHYKKADSLTSNYAMNPDTSTCTSGQLASRQSVDEKILGEIGLSTCSKVSVGTTIIFRQCIVI